MKADGGSDAGRAAAEWMLRAISDPDLSPAGQLIGQACFAASRFGAERTTRLFYEQWALLGSVFVGTYVLDFFGLSVPVVQVAGGILVSVLGWDLLRQDATASPLTIFGASGGDMATRAFYPLTLPLTVGPGSISVGVTIGANHAQGMRSLLINGASELIGVAMTAATILVCYRYADRMLKRLGSTGTSVLIRLSAFILFCIGVQIFWNGASALLAGMPRR